MSLTDITLELAAQMKFRLILDELIRRLWSKTSFYVLHRKLANEFDGGNPEIPLQVRPLKSDDINKLLGFDTQTMRNESILERVRRIHFLRAGIGTCYVAATVDDEPCHMQWIITHEDNARLLKFFKCAVPNLMHDEVMLENTFTLENYQRQGIWKWTTSRLAEKVKKWGKKKLIVFINADKTISLNACLNAGFYPVMHRDDRWILLRRYCRFKKIGIHDVCV